MNKEIQGASLMSFGIAAKHSVTLAEQPITLRRLGHYDRQQNFIQQHLHYNMRNSNIEPIICWQIHVCLQ